MAIEVLMMKDVEGVGREGDVVRVAEGYVRNYLLPRKLAAPATDVTRRRLNRMQQDREKVRLAAVDTAQAQAAKLAGVSCTITVKTGEDEKLYGSVTATEIVKALQDQGVEIDRHALELEHPIKELGVFDVPVRLHPDVTATVKVWIVEE